jgi:hypothetical protein
VASILAGEADAGEQLASRRAFVVTGAFLLFFLIIVAERSGIPREAATLGTLCVLAAALVYAALGHRSTFERPFAIGSGGLAGGAPAMALGFGLFAGVQNLLGSASGVEFLAHGLGCAAGVLVAHALAMAGEDRKPGGRGRTAVSLIAGTGALALCLPVAAASLSEIARSLLTLDFPAWLIMLVGLGCPLAAVAFGGAQGALGLVTVAGLLTLGGFTLVLGIGVLAHGAPPLPGVADASTMLAIAEARARWLPDGAMPPLMRNWPSLEELMSSGALAVFGQSMLLAAGASHLLAKASGIERGGLAATAALTCIATPLLLIAAGGYAIEAAGVAFVGASGQRPPAALVELARLGLVEVCGARPSTADALRLACGFPVRGESAISGDMLRFRNGFLPGGGPAALGFGAAVDLLSRISAPLLSLITLALALGGASLGLGRDILGLGRREPGKASLRLALIRLGALLISIALALTFSLSVPLDDRLGWLALAGGAMALLAALARALLSRSAA